MYLLTVTHYAPSQATTQYHTDDSLHVLATILDRAVQEAKLHGAKYFTFNGAPIHAIKVYATVSMNPPTSFSDVTIIASQDKLQLLEATITLMEEWNYNRKTEQIFNYF